MLLYVTGKERRTDTFRRKWYPLFDMDIDIDVSRSVSEQGLREDLHRLANALVIDLVLKKEM